MTTRNHATQRQKIKRNSICDVFRHMLHLKLDFLSAISLMKLFRYLLWANRIKGTKKSWLCDDCFTHDKLRSMENVRKMQNERKMWRKINLKLNFSPIYRNVLFCSTFSHVLVSKHYLLALTCPRKMWKYVTNLHWNYFLLIRNVLSLFGKQILVRRIETFTKNVKGVYQERSLYSNKS